MAYLTIDEARANVSAQKAAYAEADAEVDRLDAEMTRAWEKVNALSQEKIEAERNRYAEADALREALNGVGVAESNSVADGRYTRDYLVQVVENAVACRMQYAPHNEASYGEAVVRLLERKQCNVGLPSAYIELDVVSANVVNVRGKVITKRLTATQRERAMQALTQRCPRRENGNLACPYKLRICADGRVVDGPNVLVTPQV